MIVEPKSLDKIGQEGNLQVREYSDKSEENEDESQQHDRNVPRVKIDLIDQNDSQSFDKS